MSLILDYKDKTIDDEAEERILKLLNIHFAKLWKFENFTDVTGVVDSQKLAEFVVKEIRAVKFSKTETRNIFLWKTTMANMASFYLWNLLTLRKPMPLFYVANSLHFMAEDEALTYFRILTRCFPELVTAKTFNAGKISLIAYLKKIKFEQVEKFVTLLEERYVAIQKRKAEANGDQFQ
jgi:hypothetical protein